MSDRLIAAPFLFRFGIACPYVNIDWTGQSVTLPDAARVPSFATLDGRRPFADLRMAWNSRGLLLTLRVEGKKAPVWCRASRWEDSDGLSIWIATRDVSQVHRANRYCHRFILLPQGAGDEKDSPVAEMATIARARETPKPVPPNAIKLRSEKRIDGYLLQALFPGEVITGYDPQQQSQLGFYYAVVDRERGWQTFSLSPEFPFDSDPSLWGVLDLVRDK